VAVSILAVPGFHGSIITSYEIQIDDGIGGDFEELQGVSYPSLSLTGIKDTGVVGGRNYRLRYRARNEIGAGSWSDITYVLAASEPVLPTII
jgi:hypothetical protein